MAKSRGRPTDYKPEYCDQLIDHMAEGYSFEAFAGKLRLSRQTLYDWAKRYPEFLDAKNIGQDCSFYYWEGIGRRLANGTIEKGKAAIWIFIVCNRFKDDYTNKHIENTEVPQPIIIHRKTGEVTELAAVKGKK